MAPVDLFCQGSHRDPSKKDRSAPLQPSWQCLSPGAICHPCHPFSLKNKALQYYLRLLLNVIESSYDKQAAVVRGVSPPSFPKRVLQPIFEYISVYPEVLFLKNSRPSFPGTNYCSRRLPYSKESSTKMEIVNKV